MVPRKNTAKDLWKPKQIIEIMYKKSLSKLMKQLDKNLIGLKRPTDIENADESTDSMADIPGISDSSNFNLPSIDSRKLFDGGEGSGNFGHEGRPGQIGGSGEGGKSNIEDIDDEEQFTELKKIFENEIPNNIEEFKELKYNNSNKW